MLKTSLIGLAFLLPLATGCLSTSEPYDIVVNWQTVDAPTDEPNLAADVEVTYDGISGRTHGYTGTMRVSGETMEPTVNICVEVQKLVTVTSENNISCPGACESQEWVARTVPQCKDVPIGETHVMFDLVLR